MFNPLEKFRVEFVDGLLKKGYRYLVSQSYKRGEDPWEPGKTGLLLCKYNDVSHAQIHLRTIKGKDQFAAILDLETEAHRNKITELLKEDSRFVVYSDFVKTQQSAMDRLNNKFKMNIWRYLKGHTHWRITPETPLRPALELRFGEFFISIMYGTQSLTVRLDDIEKA